MTMVCFDDFDVVAFGEISGGYLDQFHGDVDADAHIGGEYDGDCFCLPFRWLFCRFHRSRLSR